jgi:hypothetical protein
MRRSLACLLALAGRSAAAEPWRVDLGGGTDVPIDVGANVRVESPSRLRLAAGLGWLPGAYVDTINTVLVGVNAYGQSTADLIRASIKNSLIVRAQVGFRPWPARGFYGEAGYGLIALGGTTTAGALIADATGKTPPPPPPGAPPIAFDVGSRLHMIDVEAGWEHPLRDDLIVRLALGGAFTIASSTTITPTSAPRDPAAGRAFTDAGAAYLDHIYTSYVFTPVVTIALAYRFE